MACQGMCATLGSVGDLERSWSLKIPMNVTRLILFRGPLGEIDSLLPRSNKRLMNSSCNKRLMNSSCRQLSLPVVTQPMLRGMLLPRSKVRWMYLGDLAESAGRLCGPEITSREFL